MNEMNQETDGNDSPEIPGWNEFATLTTAMLTIGQVRFLRTLIEQGAVDYDHEPEPGDIRDWVDARVEMLENMAEAVVSDSLQEHEHIVEPLVLELIELGYAVWDSEQKTLKATVGGCLAVGLALWMPVSRDEDAIESQSEAGADENDD